MCLYFGGFTGMYSENRSQHRPPQLSLAFGVELNIVQWLVVAYMLVIGLVLPFCQSSYEMVHCASNYPIRSLLVSYRTLISGFAGSFDICLAGRCIQGIGTGLVLPLMFAMVLGIIRLTKNWSGNGVAALVIMFAPAIGPTLWFPYWNPFLALDFLQLLHHADHSNLVCNQNLK